jgi:CRISPR-associated protein Cas1
MPPLHDPIPYDRVAELIADAGLSRQSATLHAAWREYAAKAARPYAWKTFSLYTRQQLMRSGDWSIKRSTGKLTPWQDSARASPRVLVLGAYAALRVRGGTLEIEHGSHDDRQTIRMDIDAEPKPRTILFDSHGEFLTGEAIRWCARYSINLALPGGPGRLITMVESALETKTNTKTRMRDIDPSIIRAQCAADPMKIAREIVRAKISAELNATTRDPEARREFAEWAAKLNSARSVSEIMIVESRAATSYWRTFRDAGLRERKNGNLPRSWLRFAQRNKGASFLGNKHASHPINAMLNYCYIVEAGRLAKALAARGLALPIGYLHSDKKGRNSLVWDAIEPLRPIIDAKVLDFVATHEFARSDFPQSGYSVHRLSRDVTQLLLHRASLPSCEIEEAAEWMVSTIARCAARVSEAKILLAEAGWHKHTSPAAIKTDDEVAISAATEPGVRVQIAPSLVNDQALVTRAKALADALNEQGIMTESRRVSDVEPTSECIQVV